MRQARRSCYNISLPLLRWKYALVLTLDDPGFDASVLSQFRAHLLETNASILLLHVLSDYCKHRGWLNTDGK